VGQFVLTGIPTPKSWRREKTADWQLAVSLRIQSNPENKTEFAAVSPERYDLLQERAGEKLTFFFAAQRVRRLRLWECFVALFLHQLYQLEGRGGGMLDYTRGIEKVSLGQYRNSSDA
jgi:hypothetical protein